MLVRLIFAVMAILFFAQQAQAQEVNCKNVTTSNNNDHIVVFINGIINSEDQACASLGVLRKSVDSEAEQSDFELFYNPSKTGTQGFFEDTSELRAQAKISDRAHDIAQNDYTIKLNGASARYNYVLGKLYSDTIENEGYSGEVEKEVYVRTNKLYGYLKGRVLDGKSITIVAHSQGNFYIESAIAMMRYRDENDIVSKIKVVSVAPASSSTPNSVYFSLKSDRALNWQRTQTTLLKFYKVLDSNAEACVSKLISNDCLASAKLSDQEWMMHGFTRMYMNPFILVNGISIRTRISDQVIRSRDLLTGKVPEVEVVEEKFEIPSKLSSKARFEAKFPTPTGSGVKLLLQVPFMTNGDATKYFWIFGDGQTETKLYSGTTTHIFKKYGTYRIEYYVFFESKETVRCVKVVTIKKMSESIVQYEDPPCTP